MLFFSLSSFFMTRQSLEEDLGYCRERERIRKEGLVPVHVQTDPVVLDLGIQTEFITPEVPFFPSPAPHRAPCRCFVLSHALALPLLHSPHATPLLPVAHFTSLSFASHRHLYHCHHHHNDSQ